MASFGPNVLNCNKLKLRLAVPTRARLPSGYCCAHVSEPGQFLALAFLAGELLPKFDDVFVGGRPIGIAGIAVEEEAAGLLSIVELLLAQLDCLIVIVRTDNLELIMVAHERA
jgi:hypothetical protein